MTFPVKFGAETYNVKKFLRDHPGGVNTLEKFKGKSILGVMEFYGHSVSAYHMLNDFKIDKTDVNLTGDVSVNGRIITKEERIRDAGEVAFLEELEFVIMASRSNGPGNQDHIIEQWLNAESEPFMKKDVTTKDCLHKFSISTALGVPYNTRN